MSVEPAGANGTMMRTGRDGYASAGASRDAAGSAAAPAARCRKFRRGSFIALSLHFSGDGLPQSLRLDVRGPDHLSPLLAVGSDPRAEFLRTARDRVEAERRQAFLDLRQCHDLDDLAVEQGVALRGRSAGDRVGTPRYAFPIRL